jgi:hypothetical protein
VHVQVLDVLVIWLLVVVRREPRQALMAQVCLDRVHSFDQHIDSQVKLFLLNYQRILDVPLSQEFVVKRRLGQVRKLLEQNDAVTTPSLGWLCNERLAWVLAHVVLEVSDLVWQ